MASSTGQRRAASSEAPSVATSAPDGRGVAALPDFPVATRQYPPLRPVAHARRLGLSLRPAARADMPFLSALFADLRRPELDAAAWPEPLRRAFCASQFELQHRSFVAGFPQADFLVVEQRRNPIGRLYVDRDRRGFHLVEIALASWARRQGLGSLLLDTVKRDARRSAAPKVTLQVERSNVQARRLYERHGFRGDGQEGAHLVMRWDAPDTEAAKAR